jgi:hypothetical protein
VEHLDPLPFDPTCEEFFIRGKGIAPTRGKEVVLRLADPYLRAIQG